MGLLIVMIFKCKGQPQNIQKDTFQKAQPARGPWLRTTCFCLFESCILELEYAPPPTLSTKGRAAKSESSHAKLAAAAKNTGP